MPSSQTTLRAKIADLETELTTAKAENLTLKMQVGAMENILSYYNGSCEEMGKLLDDMNGGLCANLKRILSRHGITFKPARGPLR